MALACIVETSGQNLMKLCMHHVHCTPTEGVYHYIGKELSILQKKGLIFFNFAIFTLDFLVYLRAKRVTAGGLLATEMRVSFLENFCTWILETQDRLFRTIHHQVTRGLVFNEPTDSG